MKSESKFCLKGLPLFQLNWPLNTERDFFTELTQTSSTGKATFGWKSHSVEDVPGRSDTGQRALAWGEAGGSCLY